MKANTLLPPRVIRNPSRRKSERRSKSNDSACAHVKSILVPLDFSAPSLKALDYAINLAAATKARLTLLNVMEGVVLPEVMAERFILPTDSDVQMTRAALKRIAAEHGCTPHMLENIKIRKGTPYQEITTAARALRADMIILATHGYTGVKRVLLGSTAERVIRHATCPVLVVPARSTSQSPTLL